MESQRTPAYSKHFDGVRRRLKKLFGITQDEKNLYVVTGTRAEYGLLRWVMEEIRESASLELQVIATGMHLSPEFGLTYRDIEADGFRIDRKIEMLLSADTPSAISKSMGLAMIGFADAFDQLRPDLSLFSEIVLNFSCSLCSDDLPDSDRTLAWWRNNRRCF